MKVENLGVVIKDSQKGNYLRYKVVTEVNLLKKYTLMD